MHDMFEASAKDDRRLRLKHPLKVLENETIFLFVIFNTRQITRWFLNLPILGKLALRIAVILKNQSILVKKFSYLSKDSFLIS